MSRQKAGQPAKSKNTFRSKLISTDYKGSQVLFWECPACEKRGIPKFTNKCPRCKYVRLIT